MADRLAGDDLAAILLQHRALGRSWAEIARRLYADHGIEVSHETLRQWVASLTQPETEPAA
jgi:transposase-like protein